jgi:hypothetical protein
MSIEIREVDVSIEATLRFLASIEIGRNARSTIYLEPGSDCWLSFRAVREVSDPRFVSKISHFLSTIPCVTTIRKIFCHLWRTNRAVERLRTTTGVGAEKFGTPRNLNTAQ